MLLTYATYLQVEQLLKLQKPQSTPPAHDEMLFIVIHQTYELWFKQLLHESQLLQTQLQACDSWGSLKTLRRMLSILRIVVSQTDVLETMTPLSFNDFRAFLESSSGFQSYQFRELEIILGWRNPLIYTAFPKESPGAHAIARRLKEPTLWACFCTYLRHLDPSLPHISCEQKEGLAHEPSEALQEKLVVLIKKIPQVDLLTERLVDLDEGLQEWRYRHVKMAERTIGSKMGTGGSDGISYLKKTLHRSVFPDLWAIRAKL